MPNSLVENHEFQEFVRQFNPSFSDIPGRAVVAKEITAIVAEVKANLNVLLQKAIWTKRGMTTSFLGITAHFVAQNVQHSAVKRMPNTHTAENILAVLQEVLSELKIDSKNLVTDNGSNMIRTFRLLKEKMEDGDEAGDVDEDEASDEAVLQFSDDDDSEDDLSDLQGIQEEIDDYE